MKKKIFGAAALCAVLFVAAFNLGAGKPEIDVTMYGAVPDDALDDTLAIRKAVAEAAAIGSPCKIVFPRGEFIVGDASPTVLGTGSAVTNAPITIPFGSDDIDIVGYGATLNINDTNGVSNAIIRTFANRTRVFGITFDCDAGAMNAIKGCSGGEINGSFGGGIDCEFVSCKALNGFFSQTSPSQGQDHFLAVNAVRPKFINCYSRDSGWNGFRSSSEDDTFQNCTVIDQRGNGFRLTRGTTSRFLSCTVDSSRDSGRTSYLLDPGSTAVYPPNRRTRIFFHHCIGRSSNDGNDDGGGSVLKLAAADEVYVDNCEFSCAVGDIDSSNYAVRLEDNLRKVVIANTNITGGFIFSPEMFHGTISANADDGGFAQLTLPTGHGLSAGDTIYVQDTAIPEYNRPHDVSEVSGDNVTTSVPYVAGAIGASAYAHEGVDELHLQNVTLNNIWDQTVTTGFYLIENAHARIIDCSDVQMNFTAVGRTSKLGGFDWEMPDAGLDMLRLRNVSFTADTSNIFIGVKPTEDRGTDEVQTVTLTNNGGSPGGTFTLTLSGYGTTGAITWSSNTATMASNIQTAIRTLPGLSAADCAFVSGDYTAGAIFRVTLEGSLGNVSTMTSADSMTGSSHNIAHGTTTQGVRSTQLVTSGKTIGVNATIANEGSGTTNLVSPYQENDNGSPYAERAILFAALGDAARSYRYSAEPVTGAIDWSAGDLIENSAPAVGKASSWTARVAGAPGTWDESLPNGGALYTNVVPQGNIDTGEDALMSYTVPAGVLASGNDRLEVTAGFQIGDNTNTKRIKFNVGGTTVYDSTALAHRNGYVSMRATVARRTSANVRVTVEIVSTAASGSAIPNGAFFTSVTYDLEPNLVPATLALAFTGEATTDSDVQQQLMAVRYVPAP